jgi:hypothetical protein
LYWGADLLEAPFFSSPLPSARTKKTASLSIEPHLIGWHRYLLKRTSSNNSAYKRLSEGSLFNIYRPEMFFQAVTQLVQECNYEGYYAGIIGIWAEEDINC